MKFHLCSFLSGALVSAIILGTAVSALAISGRMTIEVDPINIQVNGETFQPTDINGNEVPVFAYNGTTYAPLRALAEAYGLEVGYDAEMQMATVKDPEAEPSTTPAPDTAPKPDYSEWSEEKEAEYQEFKKMWEIEPYLYMASASRNGAMVESYRAIYIGDLSYEEIEKEIKNMEDKGFCARLADELQSHDAIVVLFFRAYDDRPGPRNGMNLILLYDSSEE